MIGKETTVVNEGRSPHKKERQKPTFKKVGKYQIRKQIGYGAFATVYKGRDTEKKTTVAIKMIPKEKLDSKLESALQKEVSILQSIQNENVVNFFDVVLTERNYYLVLEYCGGGDLSKYLKKHGRLSEEEVQRMMHQLSSGLKCLHERQIVHRDLKLGNILLSDKSSKAIVKLADFGLARYVTQYELLQTFCGTPLNMAPEVLEGRQYNEKADLWSLGTIIFELLTGYPPFNGRSQADLLNNLKMGGLKFPNYLKISNTCLNLISWLLQYKPERRLSWKEFFEHPFIKSDPDHYALLQKQQENVNKEMKVKKQQEMEAEQKKKKEEEEKLRALEEKKRMEEMHKKQKEEKKEIAEFDDFVLIEAGTEYSSKDKTFLTNSTNPNTSRDITNIDYYNSDHTKDISREAHQNDIRNAHIQVKDPNHEDMSIIDNPSERPYNEQESAGLEKVEDYQETLTSVLQIFETALKNSDQILEMFDVSVVSSPMNEFEPEIHLLVHKSMLELKRILAVFVPNFENVQEASITDEYRAPVIATQNQEPTSPQQHTLQMINSQNIEWAIVISPYALQKLKSETIFNDRMREIIESYLMMCGILEQASNSLASSANDSRAAKVDKDLYLNSLNMSNAQSEGIEDNSTSALFKYAIELSKQGALAECLCAYQKSTQKYNHSLLVVDLLLKDLHKSKECAESESESRKLCTDDATSAIEDSEQLEFKVTDEASKQSSEVEILKGLRKALNSRLHYSKLKELDSTYIVA